MGILSGLFRTRDGPKNATSGSTYSFFMGTSAAGKSVNERSAMQMTAVYVGLLFVMKEETLFEAVDKIKGKLVKKK